MVQALCIDPSAVRCKLSDYVADTFATVSMHLLTILRRFLESLNDSFLQKHLGGEHNTFLLIDSLPSRLLGAAYISNSLEVSCTSACDRMGRYEEEEVAPELPYFCQSWVSS